MRQMFLVKVSFYDRYRETDKVDHFIMSSESYQEVMDTILDEYESSCLSEISMTPTSEESISISKDMYENMRQAYVPDHEDDSKEDN